ncbi:b(0,+)-type amino acid transporter 1 isoform X1 [Photinus pyralis]|uniref:b(0,+)-type amino acid transporter 1 n=1 Tax=Photinus pyralis TaxID=7054 RepID=A0A1Y1KIS8_PHOPY|nr:b(0,+)-type amino acid transporter 1 isoform X1 [Photinus pyralis]
MLDTIKDFIDNRFIRTVKQENSQGNNNGFPKEGLQFRGRSTNCNGDGFIDGEGGGVEESATAGPDKLEGSGSTENDTLHLKRRVGLISGVALIVGTMIGSGIFVSPSGLLERTGSVGMSFVIWMACGFLSLLGALAYAELGTMNTSSGAEYAYFMDAFGAPPAFLFSWASTLVLKPSQMAIICLSFGKYAVEAFVNECEPPDIVVKMVALLALVVILYINCYSVNLATSVQNIFTAAKLVAVLLVIVGGIYKMCEGNIQHLQYPFQNTKFSIGNIATAFYTGLWAYDGWNNLNYVTEEIKNPSKNLPRSIIIGIPLVTVCYALINISYLTVMSPLEMTNSEAVAVTFGNRLLGVMAWLMPLSVTISTFGSANGTLFAAGRLCFAASREGHMLDILSYVHVRRYTPAPGLIFHSLIAGAMVLYGTIDSLIDFFSFTAWIFYGGSMVALMVMRYTKPNYPRPYKVPIIIPLLVFVVSIYLIIGPIIDQPTIEYLYAAMFILGGMVFYVPFVHYKVRIPLMGISNHFIHEVNGQTFFRKYSFWIEDGFRWADRLLANVTGSGSHPTHDRVISVFSIMIRRLNILL